MVSEKLLLSKRYKFQYLQLDVIEKDANGNVLVFVATFVEIGLPGKISPGSREINETLWDQSSSKRPPAYVVLGGSRKDGIQKSYFAAVDEWYRQKSRGFIDEKKERVGN